MRRLKSFILLVVLPACVTVLLLLLGLYAIEHILRARNPGYLREISTDDINFMHTYSPVYGWEMEQVSDPGKIHINDKGYRGKEYDYEKTLGATRVVILGDSVAFGYKTDESDVFAPVLDTMHKNLEVINLSVQGYGTDQELIKLEREGLQFNPDIVILVCALENDALDNSSAKFVFDNEHPKPYFVYENGELVLKDDHIRMPFLKRTAFVLSQKSILYNKLLDALEVDKKEYKRGLVGEDTQGPPDYELTFRLIRRMHDILAERDIRFAAAIFPRRPDFKEDVTTTADAFKESSILEGVQLIDLCALYKENGFHRDSLGAYSFDKQLHLTAKGHRLTAKILYEVLQELGWLRLEASNRSDQG